VQRRVAVPYPAGKHVAELFFYPSSESVVLEQYLPAVRTFYFREHSRRVPFVAPCAFAPGFLFAYQISERVVFVFPFSGFDEFPAALILPVLAVEPLKKVSRPVGITVLYIYIFKDRF
jgi:hypothetical protein